MSIEVAASLGLAQWPISQELKAAEEVQARLLSRTRPQLSTLQFGAACAPARCIGGDFYDFLDLGRGHVTLALGDVSGKGIPAALMMAALQSALRSNYSAGVTDMWRLLRSINQLFFESTAPNDYATLFLAEYADDTRRLRFANCGHNPPLLVHDDGTVDRLEATATVLGLFNQWECACKEVSLQCGDSLLLFSDGIIEAINEQGEEFGEARLIEALQVHCCLPVPVLANAMMADVRTFTGGTQHDDMTLVVVRSTAIAH